MSRLLVRGGRIIDPYHEVDGLLDLLIEDGVVQEVGPGLQAKDTQVVDATNRLVLPGLIDIHCHLRDPGYEYKEDIASGTRSAARGGFTSVCCMANTNPVNDQASVTSYILQRAKDIGNGVHVYPIGAVTKGLHGNELAEIGALKAAGAVAISDDGRPLMNAQMLRLALQYADYFDIPLLSHSEDVALVDEGVMNEGEVSTRLGLRGTTRAAEEVMIARDIVIAETFGKHIHLCHVSTKGGVQLIREAKLRGVRVTAETAPHYVCATEDWVGEYDTAARVNPPLRTELDRIACIEGLVDGTLDCIATDHAPHHADEKNVEYSLAASGISGFESAFSVCWTHLVLPGYLTPKDLVRLMTCAPAKILRLSAGTLGIGVPADFVIIDPAETWTVESSSLLSKGKNNLFAGKSYTGRILETYISGQCIHKEG